MFYIIRFGIVILIYALFGGCVNEGPVSVNEGPVSSGQEEAATQVNGPSDGLAKTTVSRAEIMVFQPAGDFGGGVLVPGTEFPPTNGGFSILHRGDDWISYNLHTIDITPRR
jgi:hypothetical protein